MKRFIKNVLYGLLHFCSSSGRDSRQTYCDIYRGFLLLVVLGTVCMLWADGPVRKFVQEWLLLSNMACWCIFIVFLGVLLLAYVNAVLRRWQDLDIRIPKGDSFDELIKRARFYEVLAQEEGSHEKNQYGPAPKENPLPLISEEDMRKLVRKRLFADLDGIENIK